MQDFVNYLEKENVIRKLKEFYKVGLNNHIKAIFLNRILETLALFNNEEKPNKYNISSDLSNKNLDIFSKIYEKTRNHKEKKKFGEFYTPAPVVKYILDAINYNSSNQVEAKRLIDISCGSGSFIIQAIGELIKYFLRIYNRDDVSNLTVEEAKSIISTVKNTISGIDINPIACILCQINIQYTLFEILNLVLAFEPNYSLPFFDIRNFNALTIKSEKNYDYVVGNPPYLFIRDIPPYQRQIIETANFVTKEGQYDYYQIFIELGIRMLKNGGMLGYIVPDSLLALSNRSILRKYIYNQTKIKEIYHTGPKFSDPVVSNIIIILEKESRTLKRTNNQIKVKLSNQHEETIPQKAIGNWDCKFLIHLNKNDILILEQLNSEFSRLKDLFKKYNIKIELSRGVELGKTGKIIFCEKCNKYLPIPHKKLICHLCSSNLNKRNMENIIYDTIPSNTVQENLQLFLYSMNRYQITQYKYIDTSKVGINYKEFNLYEDRIIIRQLSQNGKICATYDKNLSFTSQSLYNLRIKKSSIPEFNNFYLLGLFNSMLLSYFFIKSFGTYKKLFPRILIEKIKDFPIKVPISNKEKENAKKIIENVKLLLETNDEREELQDSIDSLVFDLYEISENNREYILNYMKTLNN
ncbi:MAG: Eco57I restriction-modification methylase domain-containing protein [Candidatus Hermodarchaeota archaeon]